MAVPNITVKQNTENKSEFNSESVERRISVTTRNTNQKGNVVKSILYAAVMLSLFCGFIYTKSQINELYNEISSSKKKIELLTSENVRMQSELETKMSMKNVEDYAENMLGLTKLSKSQIVYMEVQADSVVEVTPETENVYITIRDKVDDLLEYILG